MFFQAGGAGAAPVLPLASYLRMEPADQAIVTRQMTADQQRIRWLEIQNRQLQADIARWKNFSICFAHDVQESLKD
jgi:hypothetical protein